MVIWNQSERTPQFGQVLDFPPIRSTNRLLGAVYRHQIYYIAFHHSVQLKYLINNHLKSPSPPPTHSSPPPPPPKKKKKKKKKEEEEKKNSPLLTLATLNSAFKRTSAL